MYASVEVDHLRNIFYCPIFNTRHIYNIFTVFFFVRCGFLKDVNLFLWQKSHTKSIIPMNKIYVFLRCLSNVMNVQNAFKRHPCVNLESTKLNTSKEIVLCVKMAIFAHISKVQVCDDWRMIISFNITYFFFNYLNFWVLTSKKKVLSDTSFLY